MSYQWSQSLRSIWWRLRRFRSLVWVSWKLKKKRNPRLNCVQKSLLIFRKVWKRLIRSKLCIWCPQSRGYLFQVNFYKLHLQVSGVKSFVSGLQSLRRKMWSFAKKDSILRPSCERFSMMKWSKKKILKWVMNLFWGVFYGFPSKLLRLQTNISCFCI